MYFNIECCINLCVIFSSTLQGDIVKATEICPSRIRTKRSSQNLESEIIQIKKQIQHAMKV